MKIYVAGKFEQKPRIRSLMMALEKRGHTITHDWTKEDATGKTGDELDAYLDRCAQADVDGVLTADALVILPHPQGKGLYVELGLALSKWDMPIYAIGDKGKEPCIFLKLKRVTWFATEEGFLMQLDEQRSVA